ncbi:MAG TPA: AlkA N-terminal domain-containing protein [Actinomycetota bacterium]|nr:AlkA N-terminal domain-containing protein [Actinomycetota bacterium]
MDLDGDRCYRALLSRDRRFDGRFFTGVLTTGVYCRPVCPAPTPKQRNVRFYPSAAAAEAAGFRPCLRCKPEHSAGIPAWPAVPEPVSRALSLIAGGALDDGGVDGLARLAGVGARQLRRLFESHVGASPLAVGRARRVHFAKRMLDETDRPVGEIAFAAGYGSIRSFNHDFALTFKRPPSQVRRSGRRGPAGAITMRLAYRPPLDWESLIGFLATRATRGVEAATADAYRRTILADGAPGSIEIRHAPGEPYLLLTVTTASPARLLSVVERARRIADLGADPMRIDEVLAADDALRHLVNARPGLRVPGAWDGFEVAVRAIVGQQVSVAGATTVASRLVDLFGKPVETDLGEGLTHLFPSPATLANAEVEAAGLRGAQARAIRALARAVDDGRVRIDSSDGLIGTLTALPGIGEWTAHYVAMRAGGDPDAFPAADLGLRKAFGQGSAVSARALAAAAERWRPWRSYAAMHLWRSLSDKEPR